MKPLIAIILFAIAASAWAAPESIKVGHSETSGTSDFAISSGSTSSVLWEHVVGRPNVSTDGAIDTTDGGGTIDTHHSGGDILTRNDGGSISTSDGGAGMVTSGYTPSAGWFLGFDGVRNFVPTNLLPGTHVSGTVPTAAWANGAPWSGLTNVPSLVNSLAASGSNIVLSGSNGAITISLTGLATAQQGAKADAALPANEGTGTNITLTGTTGVRASGTGAAPFAIYQDATNGQMMIAVPNGALALYYDGDKPVMVFNGSIQCSDISANLNVASAIDAGIITTGQIALGRLPYWANNFSTGYPGYGQINSTPVNTPYFFSWTSTDASGGAQTISYRTASQIKTDMMMLTGTASITWDPISSASTGTKTLTVTGADPASIPSVHLGWSAALPAGLEVAQAWVSGTNTVSIALRNNTGSTITPSAITVRATVHMP